MSTEARKSCTRCGAILHEGWCGSVCPRCMLSVALEAGDEARLENGDETAERAMASDLPALPAHLERLGDYALIEEIGRGGMGIVFKARQLKLNRLVAVKLLLLGPLATRESVQRFRREATAAAGLQHPNIVEIHEVGEVNGQPYFSMDYIEGRSLAELIAERGARQPDFTQSAEWCQQIAGAVHYAHQHGILEIWDIEETPRRILDRAGSEPFTGLALSPDGRNVNCAAKDYHVHRWESFPWREEDYARKAEGGRQKAESRESGPHTEWAAKVRQYARSYWRERLQAELHGVEGDSAEPRVIEVPLDRTLFPKRNPQAGDNQLDLSGFYTGELGETFHGRVSPALQQDDDLSELAAGVVELGGIAFDIRGVIQLRRAEPLGGAWELATLDDPVRVDGIPIQQETSRLHLLLGTVRGKNNVQGDGTAQGEEAVPGEGAVIGRLELHYVDGETRSLDLVYGRDVRDWWYDPARATIDATDHAKVVWTGMNPVANEYGHRLRLYLNTRDNPRPGVKLTTFDFVSAMTETAPFLIAVTVQ